MSMSASRSVPFRLRVVCAIAAGALSLASCGGVDGNPPPQADATPSAKRPNILYIMADDLGYSDIHAFGGEINTPNLDALVASGRILSNHHTGTVCAITRAMLISGTDHHLVGEGTMGVPTDERRGLPGYEGYLNDRALSFAQLLKDAGYHTYIAGKWHIGSGIVGSATGSGQTPDQWGFERSYVLLGGAATNHFAHEPAGSSNYTEDGRYVQPGQPGQPGDAGGSVRVDRDFDRFRLTSLTSYQDSRNVQRFDLTDGLIYSALSKRPASLFDVPGADQTEMRFGESTFQQEVRLNSRDNSPVMWTAGINYFHAHFTNDTNAVASPAALNFVTTQNGQQHNRINTDSVSWFGEASWPLTTRLKAVTGLRATYERKDARYAFDGNGNPKVVTRFRQDDSLSDTFVTGRTGLTFDWTDTLMTYATVSRGEASAGYPAVTVNGPQGRRESSFPASTSWTYELGFKSLWLDRRLSVDGSVFYNDVKNGHLVAFFPSSGLFMPASLDYRTFGAELELGAKVSRYLRLTAGLGYTQGELRSVPVGDVTGAQSGNRLPNVPRMTGNLGAHGELPGTVVGLPGRFNADASWQYVGSRAVDVRNSFDLAAYSVVNLRVGWTYRNWTLYGFAENLFDRRYVVAGQGWAPGVGSVRVGQPRVVGIGLTTQL